MMTKPNTLSRRLFVAGIATAALAVSLTLGGTAIADESAFPVPDEFKDFVIPAIGGNDDSLERVRKDGLIVATSNDWPYSYLDVNTGEWKGIEADIIRYATKMIGIDKIKLETVNWDGLVPGVSSGRFDMIGDAINYTADRAKVISFSFPNYYYAETLVVKKGNPLNLHQMKDLVGHKVGTLIGSNYATYLEAVPGINIETYQDWQQMLPQLSIGRIDAVIYDQPVMAATIADHPEWEVEVIDDYQPAALKNPANYSRYVFRQKDIALMSAFDSAIQWMQVNGVMKQVLEKWGLSGFNN